VGKLAGYWTLLRSSKPLASLQNPPNGPKLLILALITTITAQASLPVHLPPALNAFLCTVEFLYVSGPTPHALPCNDRTVVVIHRSCIANPPRLLAGS
jgi:hypothetical protein